MSSALSMVFWASDSAVLARELRWDVFSQPDILMKVLRVLASSFGLLDYQCILVTP